MVRRGITPVIAVTLLLGMTVAASGGAYAWISQVQQQAQEEASQGLATRLDVKDAVCTRYGNVEVSIKNNGDAMLTATESDIFVRDGDGDLVSQRTGIDISGATWRQPGGFGAVSGTIGTDFAYLFVSNRNVPHTVAVYAPYDNATVEYYLNTTKDSGTVNTTLEVPEGGIETLTTTSNGDHRFYSTEPVVIAKEAGGDRIYVPPAHEELLHTRPGNFRSTVSGASIENHDPFLNSTDPFASTQIADGCGSDSDLGIPTTMLGDTYVVPHEMDDYAIAAIGSTTVTVKEWTGSGFSTFDTHDLTSASRAAPGNVEVDDQSGPCDSIQNISEPVLVEGTGNFYLRTNDPSSDEYPVIPYGTGAYDEAVALFPGSVDYATVQDGTTININGSAVVTAATPQAGSFSVGRGDRITFNRPVGLEMRDGYPVPPVETARRILHEGRAYTVEVRAGGATATGTCRPEPAD